MTVNIIMACGDQDKRKCLYISLRFYRMVVGVLKFIIATYCDLRGRIKGTARALYPVYGERAHYGQ